MSHALKMTRTGCRTNDCSCTSYFQKIIISEWNLIFPLQATIGSPRDFSSSLPFLTPLCQTYLYQKVCKLLQVRYLSQAKSPWNNFKIQWYRRDECFFLKKPTNKKNPTQEQKKKRKTASWLIKNKEAKSHFQGTQLQEKKYEEFKRSTCSLCSRRNHKSSLNWQPNYMLGHI